MPVGSTRMQMISEKAVAALITGLLAGCVAAGCASESQRSSEVSGGQAESTRADPPLIHDGLTDEQKLGRLVAAGATDHPDWDRLHEAWAKGNLEAFYGQQRESVAGLTPIEAAKSLFPQAPSDRTVVLMEKIAEALAADPNSTDILLLRGRTFQSKHGDYPRAIQDYRRVLVLDEDHYDGGYYLAVCLYRTKRYDEALRELTRLLDIGHDAYRVHMLLGYCYRQKGDLHATLTHYTRASVLNPESHSAARGIEHIQRAIDRREGAQETTGNGR